VGQKWVRPIKNGVLALERHNKWAENYKKQMSPKEKDCHRVE